MIARAALIVSLTSWLGACAMIPNSGPSTGDIVDKKGTSGAPQYELVDITPQVIGILRGQNHESFEARFGDYRPSQEPRIGVGDSVEVLIWEASPNGLFSAAATSDAESLSTGSRDTVIPSQVVGRDGAISVPYAGRVPVVGRTTRGVQKIIEDALKGKAIQPQVVVNVTHAVSTTVTVTGEVTNGSRVPLSVRGDRIMDVIAEAGGVRAPVDETYVQLSRGTVTARVPLSRVASDAREDIYLRPDDVLTLIHDPQTFIAYGATGKNDEIPFDAEGITLAQAVAKAGGLVDTRSDATGIFVVRHEPESVVRLLHPDLSLPGPQIPVVYRLNMRDPNSLFAMQSFQLRNRDLVYVSNAPLTDMQKVMGIASGTMSPGLSAAQVCVEAGCR